MNDGGDTMKEPLDLSKYSVRTDLAVEAHQMLQERQEEQKRDRRRYCKREGRRRYYRYKSYN